MNTKLLTKHNLEHLSLKGDCNGSSESTHDKIPHCWKSHGSLRCLKEAQTMEMILDKCKFENSLSLFSVTYVVGTHWNCLTDIIQMCIYVICSCNKRVFAP